jgi:hypothetical protein
VRMDIHGRELLLPLLACDAPVDQARMAGSDQSKLSIRTGWHIEKVWRGRIQV